MINKNPHVITSIPAPTEEMKLLALRKNGLLLEYIDHPTTEMTELALENNPHAIRFIDTPTEEMMQKAVQSGWTNLEYIKHPTDQVIRLALSQAGWAIKFVPDPSEELQLLAVRKNYDAIRFIKAPFPSVQETAVTASYDALRYISSPTHQAELIAVKNNEEAIKFINDLNKEKLLELLKVNILILKYVMKSVSQEELESAVREVISREDVEEQYVRDFMNYRTLEQSPINQIDKLKFLHRYGSKKAKKIAVDERLKM
jgi:hypothetical protein